jgi:hypothetical protein
MTGRCSLGRPDRAAQRAAGNDAPGLTHHDGVIIMKADPYSWQTREERKRLAERLYADGWERPINLRR